MAAKRHLASRSWAAANLPLYPSVVVAAVGEQRELVQIAVVHLAPVRPTPTGFDIGVGTLEAAPVIWAVLEVMVAGSLVENDNETCQGCERRRSQRAQRLQGLWIGSVVAEDESAGRIEKRGGLSVKEAAG